MVHLRKAFTLLELIVTLVILAVLATLAVPTFAQVIAQSKLETAEVTASSIARETLALASFDGRAMVEADVQTATNDLPRKQAYVTGLSASAVSEYEVVFGKWEFSGGTNTISASLGGSPKGELLGVAIGLPGVGCAFAKTDGRNVTSWSKAGMDITSCNGLAAFADEDELGNLKAPPVPNGLNISFGECIANGAPGWGLEFTSGMVDVFVNGKFIGTFASGSCIPGDADDVITVVDASPEGGWPGAPGDVFDDGVIELPDTPEPDEEPTEEPTEPGEGENGGAVTPPVTVAPGQGIIISWPSASSPSPVTVERSGDGGKTWETIPSGSVQQGGGGNSSSFITDKPGDGDFIYRGSNSQGSVVVEAGKAIPPAPVPDDPQNSGGVSVSVLNNSIIVAWSDVADDQILAPLAGYRLWQSIDGGNMLQIKTTPKGETTAIINVNNPGKYCYRVASYGFGGQSPMSPESCVSFTLKSPVVSPGQKILASDAGLNKAFGASSSISGNTMVIGSPSDGQNGTGAGSAYVFTRTDGKWVETFKLVGSDTKAGDSFGSNISLSGDTVAITAAGESTNGTSSGAVYVFTKTGDSWLQTAKLTQPNAKAGDLFGMGMSLSGDTLAIGAPYSSEVGFRTGAVYIFTRTGDTWDAGVRLVANDPTANDSFGAAISIDGETMAIGASAKYVVTKGRNAGVVYMFNKQSGAWVQNGKIEAPTSTTRTAFGSAVSVSGNTVAITENGGVSPVGTTGRVFIHTYNGSTWAQSAMVYPFNGANADLFGNSLSLKGGILAVGAPASDFEGTDSGSVYVYHKGVGGWGGRTQLGSGETGQAVRLGTTVSLDGGTVVTGGTAGKTSTGVTSGAAYTFNLS